MNRFNSVNDAGLDVLETSSSVRPGLHLLIVPPG